MFFNSLYDITGTTSEFESNPKYITFPNSARIEFHYRHPNEVSWFNYKDLGFIPLEDVIGPTISYVVDKSEEEKKKE
jgi:hypothetical protein